jgi:hypothetical protein
MKYIKLFENFESTIFDSAAIESFNKKLYDKIDKGIPFYYTHDIIKDLSKEIYDIIKSVDIFKEVDFELTDGQIKVDWNDVCCPFEITFSECGRVNPSSGEEDERIRIDFVGQYPFEIEELETGEIEHDAERGTYVEYIFTKNQDSSENYYLSIDKWNDDVLPRLFRNIEKSIDNR